MIFSLFIARRLSLSTDGRKSSPAIKVSVTAVALSIAVMLASVAVVIGFKREISEKVIGFNSHITLYASPAADAGDNILTLTPSLRKILESEPYVTDFSLGASIPAILKTAENFKGVYLRSLGEGHTSRFIADNLADGRIPDYTKPESKNDIVISSAAARQLGLKTGDMIDTYFISDDIRVRRLRIAGIYDSHFDSYDQVMIYGALQLIQGIAGLSANQGTSLQIQTDDFAEIDDNTGRLQKTLIDALADGTLYRYYKAENARTQGAGYFHWLSLLDTNVIVVLTLMAIVAIATLISGMLILILDKKRIIGVLRAIGAPTRKIRNIFIFLAMKVALTGMLAGNIIMLALLWCQDRWHFLPLDPEAYYIDFVPVEISWQAVAALNAACLLLIYASLIVPSRFAAGISPADSMRTDT
ncbi:MAG: FtsX-like permease family protein [Muribaculaceae bacterium]|nr:FtsX-like permease family protein [Muribaculaceae bacterium]